MAIKRGIKKETAYLFKEDEEVVKAAEDVQEEGIEDDNDIIQIRWRLKSGSLRLADGRSFEAGQTFLAYEHEINKAFRDTVVPADPIAQIKEKKAPIKFHKVLIEATDAEKAEEGYVPLYNVANVSGVTINPSPLNEQDAVKLLSILNGA